MIYSYVLSSGLTLVVMPNYHIPMVNIDIVYDFDPRLVPDGVPHLTEHLLFEGTANIPNGDVDRWLRLAGGSSTASTTWDSIVLHNTISAPNIEWLLYIESERSRYLCDGIVDEDIENQRMVIANEMFSAALQPNGDVADRLRKKSFTGHEIISSEVMGQIYDLETATRNDICSFATQWLQPKQSTWIVTGDVDVDWLRQRLEVYFPSIESVVDSHVNTTNRKPETFQERGIPIVQNEGHRWFKESKQDSSMSADRLTLVFASPPAGTIEESVADAMLLSLTQSQTWEHFSSIDHIQGWSENRSYGGWMALSIRTSHPKKAMEELQVWLENPQIDWPHWDDRQQYLVAQYLETNNGRIALLNGCLQSLETSEITDCVTWQRQRYSEEVTKEDIDSTRDFWDIEEASWLWMGQENWFDGERF